MALLRDDWKRRHQVINGSISGDTTGGGLNRLPLLLEKFSPDYVLLELGGNDGLRGQPLSLMKGNLQNMIELCRQAGARTRIIWHAPAPQLWPTLLRCLCRGVSAAI